MGEEIERMVREAEENADEDKKLKDRIDAKNAFEGYVYNVRNTINDDDKVKDKLDEDDVKKVQDEVKAMTEWMDENPNAEKEEYEEKQKEFEMLVNPIFSKLYQGGGAGGEGGDSAEDEEMPDHDEL